MQKIVNLKMNKMQNAKSKMQNAKCKMQNAKCKKPESILASNHFEARIDFAFCFFNKLPLRQSHPNMGQL